MLPVDELQSVMDAIPSMHDKIFLGLKKTVGPAAILAFVDTPCSHLDDSMLPGLPGCLAHHAGGAPQTHSAHVFLTLHRDPAPNTQHIPVFQSLTTTLQVFYKLCLLTQRQLCLIRLFLHAMAGTDAERQLAKIERMLPGLANNIDMGLVQVLAWYDRCAFRMRNKVGAASNMRGGEAAEGLSKASTQPASNTAGSCSVEAGVRFADTVFAVGALPKRTPAPPFLPHCTADIGVQDTGDEVAVSSHLRSADPLSPRNEAGVAVAAHWQDAVAGLAQEEEGVTNTGSAWVGGGTHPSLQNDADLQEFSEELSRLEAEKEEQQAVGRIGSVYASAVCLCLCCAFREFTPSITGFSGQFVGDESQQKAG
jgi:hypothetical protein